MLAGLSKTLIPLFFLFMTHTWINAQETTIVYIGDPMCSWCYGFAPEISEVKEHYPNLNFEVVLGGLRPNGTETMKDLGDFLEHHWAEVHERSGQPFNYGIIGDETFILDTEPGCRAVVAARSMKAGIEMDFFKAVQKAFFVDNKDMRASETFGDVAEEMGFDRAEFLQVFESEECRYNTRADFQLSAEMGIRGFPSVVVKHGDQFFLIANGYREADDLIKTIDKITSGKGG